ncbi:MAG: CHAD domain-containing protein [Flavobacterium sp.]|nr:CHAD domain-containing protein [Flavobacterium sp.]
MKALETYFKNRKKALNLILEKAPDSYTIETFHELRVEIKRLKALFELIAFCSKKFKSRKTFKPFRIIFKQAGKIRELQLEQTILKEQPDFHLLKKYPSRLKKQETKKIKKFFSIANKLLIKKLKGKYRKIIRLITKISKKKVNRYRNKTRKEITKLIRKNPFKKKQIHDFRKRLKVYQYNEKIENPDQQNKLIPDKNVLSAMLGKWHDYEVIIIHLKKIIPFYKTNSNERKLLKSIKAIVTSKRELLFRKINATLPYQTL